MRNPAQPSTLARSNQEDEENGSGPVSDNPTDRGLACRSQGRFLVGRDFINTYLQSRHATGRHPSFMATGVHPLVSLEMANALTRIVVPITPDMPANNFPKPIPIK